MTAEHGPQEAAHATGAPLPSTLLRTTTTDDRPERGPADGPGTSIETAGTTADQPSRAQGDTVPPPTGGQARTQDAPPDYVYGSPPRHCRTNTPSTPVPELQLLQPVPRIQVRPPRFDVDTGAERPPVRYPPGDRPCPPRPCSIFLKPDGIPSPFPPLSLSYPEHLHAGPVQRVLLRHNGRSRHARHQQRLRGRRPGPPRPYPPGGPPRSPPGTLRQEPGVRPVPPDPGQPDRGTHGARHTELAGGREPGGGRPVRAESQEGQRGERRAAPRGDAWPAERGPQVSTLWKAECGEVGKGEGRRLPL